MVTAPWITRDGAHSVGGGRGYNHVARVAVSHGRIRYVSRETCMSNEINRARGCGRNPSAGLSSGVVSSARMKMLTVRRRIIFQRDGVAA